MQTESVKEYVTRKIDASGKFQTQIAEEAGFSKPNIISMIKKGHTRVPLARVPALARAIGADPGKLMTMCLDEYDPHLLDALREVYGLPSGISTDEVAPL